MRRFQVRLLVAGALLAAGTPALPAGAQQPDLTTAAATATVRFQVTGHVRPWADYRAQGLTAVQATVLAQLDQLAADGLDPAMLTRAALAFTPPATEDSGKDSLREPGVFLSPVEDLDGRGGRDVLEQRYLPSGSSTVLQILARDGSTGRLLWSRKEKVSDQGYQVAVPMRVGAGSRPGVILLREVFQDDTIQARMTALDGRGKTLWTRTLATTWRTESSGGFGTTFNFSMLTVLYRFDAQLRKGAPDVVQQVEQYSEEDNNGVTSQHGSLRFTAVSGANGAARALPGAVDSKDGAATGAVVSDQGGDGLLDLVSIDAGSPHKITVRRAADGRTLWERTDLATNGNAYVGEAGVVTGAVAAGRRVADLVLLTRGDPGKLGGAKSTPVTTIADPTTAAHGQVTLLAGGTGKTVWSKAGDAPYPLVRAGVPALGVMTDLSSTTASAYTAKVQLDVYDGAGKARWQKTFMLSVPHEATEEDAYVGGFALPFTDLDGDGGTEGFVLLYVFSNSSDRVQVSIVRASDGASLKDTTSGFLMGGVTRKGQDRVLVTSAASGLVVKVLRGSDSLPLFTRVVPGSKGVPSGYASAAKLGSSPCSDVVVSGSGKGRAVVAVLASDGTVRWSLGRASADQRPGTPVLPRTAPRPRC